MQIAPSIHRRRFTPVQSIVNKLKKHLAPAWVEYAGIPINDTQDVAKRYAAFGEPLSLDAFPAR